MANARDFFIKCKIISSMYKSLIIFYNKGVEYYFYYYSTYTQQLSPISFNLLASKLPWKQKHESLLKKTAYEAFLKINQAV